MSSRKSLIPVCLFALFAVFCSETPASIDQNPNPPQQTTGDITLDAATLYQRMNGWEVSDWVGQWACGGAYPTALYDRYRDAVFDGAVDLGINRVRLVVRASSERPDDPFEDFRAGRISEAQWTSIWYTAINDNEDPNNLNPAGFHFTETDLAIERVVLPLKQRLEARGEKLYINLNFVRFGSNGLDYQREPAEYAEFILAAFLHMQSTYGWVPDAVEIILEPDTGSDDWTGTQIGNALVATANRLRLAGFNPDFIAPSHANMGRAVRAFDEVIAVPGARQLITELSYHRYNGVSAANLQAIRQRALQHGVRTAMTEHIGSGYVDLHEDLEVGLNSAWQQFALAGCGPGDPGGRHFLIDASNPANPVVTMARRTHFLRQYFKYIRAGAQRIAASSTNLALAPLAFINTDGRYVVVVKASGAASFSVAGLPAGRYGVSYTSGPDESTPNRSGVDAGEVTIQAGGVLSTAIPEAGVLTIFGR